METLIESRICTKCNKNMPNTNKYFYSNGRGGLATICIVCKRIYSKRPEVLRREREYKYKGLYGISHDDYDEIYNAQNGKCAICSTHQSELSVRLVVDHNHDTSEVRGLLCANCNLGLGQFKDNKSILECAIMYLNESENK